MQNYAESAGMFWKVPLPPSFGFDLMNDTAV
jgi:hypothetical protein